MGPVCDNGAIGSKGGWLPVEEECATASQKQCRGYSSWKTLLLRSSGTPESYFDYPIPFPRLLMNYLAHAIPFLDDPYFAAGTGVPDWLGVVDRKVRVRSKQIRDFLDDPDPQVAAVAGGALQHIADDRHFHATRAFAESSLAMTVMARDCLDGEKGLRPAFLGHLLVEVLLDAALTAEDPTQLDAYHAVLETIDPDRVQAAVNRMATRPTDRLAALIREFSRLRILSDYAEDGKLWVRMNQVMCRVGLAELPERFVDVLPGARQMVAARRVELLEGIPSDPSAV